MRARRRALRPRVAGATARRAQALRTSRVLIRKASCAPRARARRAPAAPAGHVQHDLITKVERGLLKRPDTELSALAGYAGGSHTSEGGRVCYHSMSGAADYGALGHAEVVSLDLPDADAARAAAVFLDSTCEKGVRRDVQDRGAEYRSVVGFPGGIDSRAGRAFSAAAAARGVRVRAGSGDDADARGTVWVLDSAQFPFFQAEVYHQFHDDMTEVYSAAYHALKAAFVGAGRLRATGCPRDEV